MAEEVKAVVNQRRQGEPLSEQQRLFLVEVHARFGTPAEVRASWAERWPTEPIPSPETMRRYRLPLVKEGPYADLFAKEREAYRSNLGPLAEKSKRIEWLEEMAASLRERIAGLGEERQEATVTGPSHREEFQTDPETGEKTRVLVPVTATTRRVRSARCELEKHLRETLAQIDQEVGRVSKVEVTGAEGGAIAVEFGHMSPAELAKIILDEQAARGEETEG